MLRSAVGILLFVGATAEAVSLPVPGSYASIQTAIDSALSGDTVAVSPGLYKEHLDFRGKSIVVRGIGGRDSTFIDAFLFQVPIVRMTSGEDSNAVLEGFTLRYAKDAPAVQCQSSSPVIQWCTMSFNEEQGRGGNGVYCYFQSSPIIRYNVFHDNAAQRGGAVRAYIAGRVSIHHNEMYGNWAGVGSAIYSAFSEATTIHHNLIHGNQMPGVYAIHLYDGTNTVYNNAVVGNGQGIYAYYAADVRNNIIAQNSGDALLLVWGSARYNDLWDNGGAGDPGPGGLTTDPLFVDPSAGAFALQAGSPCIDAGDPDPVYNDPDGSRSDIGPGSSAGAPLVAIWTGCPIGLPGDINASGGLTSADLILCVNYVFKSGMSPLPCAMNADIDCSGKVNAVDLIHYVNYMFGASAAGAGAVLKGGGDPPCINCRMIYYGRSTCP